MAALVSCLLSRVDLSMIDGRLKVYREELLGVDLPTLIRQHNEIAARPVNR